MKEEKRGLVAMIKSLEIFKKYVPDSEDSYAPTNCSHDDIVMCACKTPPSDMDGVDAETLVDLGWDWNEHEECWHSFRFGSC